MSNFQQQYDRTSARIAQAPVGEGLREEARADLHRLQAAHDADLAEQIGAQPSAPVDEPVETATDETRHEFVVPPPVEDGFPEDLPVKEQGVANPRDVESVPDPRWARVEAMEFATRISANRLIDGSIVELARTIEAYIKGE